MLVTVVQVGDVRMRVEHRCMLMSVHVPAAEPAGMLVVVVAVVVGVLMLVVHRDVGVLMLV